MAVPCSGPKSLPVYPFNVLIFPILRDCLQSVCIFLSLTTTTHRYRIEGKIAAHSAYDMFSWYKYLIVILVFSHLGFWSGNLFLIAPFLDLCLLVPLYKSNKEQLIQSLKGHSCARDVQRKYFP